MQSTDLNAWNRSLIEETIQELEASKQSTDRAIGRLRGYLAVNPGGPAQQPANQEQTTDRIIHTVGQ
jgi:hypothetical protein